MVITRTVEMIVILDGYNKTQDGREWTLDADGANEIIKQFTDKGIDKVVDYEHQSIGGKHSSPDGTSPAAGWIKALRYEAGKGLIAVIEWTERAAALIQTREYKYFSPVLITTKDDKRVIRLDSVAITNTPAVSNIEPLAAKDNLERIAAKMIELPAATEKKKMKFCDETLKLAMTHKIITKDDTPEQVEEKITQAFTPAVEPEDKLAPALSAIGKLLGIENDATVENICAAINKHKASSVSGTEYAALKDRINTLELTDKNASAKLLVEKFVQTGQLLPADTGKMEWALKCAVTDPANFEMLMKDAPKLYTPGQLVNPPIPGGGPTKRQQVIDKSLAEFKVNRDRLRGIEPWAYVDQALNTEEHDRLSKTERTALKV